jgi:hypothetical protein
MDVCNEIIVRYSLETGIVNLVVNRPRFGCYSLGYVVQLDCTS